MKEDTSRPRRMREMIDKDKAMPRLTYQEIGQVLSKRWVCWTQLADVEKATLAQRDADLKRMEPLVTLLEAGLQAGSDGSGDYIASAEAWKATAREVLAGLGVEP